MKLKLPDVSTVIILNKNRNSTKTLQIKTKHINRFKHYVLGVLVVVISLAATVFYLNNKSDRQEAEKKQLLAQLIKLKGSIPTATNKPASAQTYIQAIEGKLQKINGYLRKRGLPGFTTNNVGGSDKEANKLTDNEKYSLYDEYLSRLVKTMAVTPLGYPRISSLTSFFGYRSNPFDGEGAEFHPGIDFKGERGDAVKCTASGTVVFTGWFGGYGNCIRIQHANGLETLYGHLSKIGVKEGQNVTVGDVIGGIGSTGRSTGTHLHYEVRKNGKPVNPTKYLTLGS